MKEILIGSAFLVLALALLRLTLGKRLPARMGYALWGVVALRLLIPGGLGQSGVSVMNALPAANPPAIQAALPPAAQPQPVQQTELTGPGPLPDGSEGLQIPWTAIWAAGSAASALWMLAANLRFGRRLRQNRLRLPDEDCPLPVYLCPGLSGPCLWGLARPAIYLNEAAAQPEMKRWAVRHELQHYRHGDQLWGLVRCACLAAYWFYPPVWLAAKLSRQDGELACDEGAAAGLSNEGRREYGRALLTLTPEKGAKIPLAAAGMGGGARATKARLLRLVDGHKTAVWAMGLAAVLTAGLAAAALTGAAVPTEPDPKEAADRAANLRYEEFENEEERLASSVYQAALKLTPEGQYVAFYQDFAQGLLVYTGSEDYSLGEASPDDGPVYGHIYWRQPDGTVTRLDENGEDGYRLWTPVTVGRTILFGMDIFTGNGFMPEIWALAPNDAVPRPIQVYGHQIQWTDGMDFSVFVTDWDAAEDEDGFTGRTEKIYWLYWDEKAGAFREYGGREISRTELLALETSGTNRMGRQLLKAIDRIGTLDSIYLRGNGVVNINYSVEKDGGLRHHNATLQLADGELCLVTFKDTIAESGVELLDITDQGGVYQQAVWPEIAVLPE
ncbi:MAG: M56 family metallopeptidase [Oscillospiraceae bacterium]|nr:M56 family metallopeptidase [Oscillospiraceae bacterium]